MKTGFSHRAIIILAASTLLALSGCGGGPSYEIAEVEGTLLIKGQPGNKIGIQFIPDVDAGTQGPVSTADTDDSGHFKLQVMSGAGGAPEFGAVVGSHRIVLTDLQLAASATGQGVPIRLAPEHSLPGSTPLKQEVKPGKQTIEIQVP